MSEINSERNDQSDPHLEVEAAAQHRFKIMMLGDAGVGKTALTRRFARNEFDFDYITTLGIDFMEKIVDVDGVKVKLQVWDTAGQERFRSLIRPYYRGASGVILVYDVTDQSTFDHLKQWLVTIETNSGACQVVEKVILGNKVDLKSRNVHVERAKRLAKSCRADFFEVSAKDRINVDEAFLSIARAILRRQNPKTPEGKSVSESFNISEQIPIHSKKKEKCCQVEW